LPKNLRIHAPLAYAGAGNPETRASHQYAVMRRAVELPDPADGVRYDAGYEALGWPRTPSVAVVKRGLARGRRWPSAAQKAVARGSRRVDVGPATASNALMADTIATTNTETAGVEE
jgi:hypothetical protein